MALITTGKLVSVVSADQDNDYVEISRHDKTTDTYESYKMSLAVLLSSVQAEADYTADDTFSDYGLQSDYVDIISEQSITGNKKFYSMESQDASFGTATFSDIDTKTLVVRETALFQNSLTCSGNMYGLAMSACWADLAERYESDAEYAPGTLVAFGGEKDVTVATLSSGVNAVVSDRPGFILNSGAGYRNQAALALAGKTPVRVTGTVAKFDRIVLSDRPGVGRKRLPGEIQAAVAVALEPKESEGEELVMCVTRFTL